MPRPRFERAAPELKQAILGAARKEFARAGYEVASLNRILEAAGLSKGAFYYYFDDKADLAAAVLFELYQPAMMNIEAIRNPRTREEFWAGVERMTRQQLDAVESSRESMDVLSNLGREMARNRELAAKMMPTFAPAMSAFVEMLGRGQELGAVRKDLTPQELAAVVSGLKEGLARVFFPAEGKLSPEELERFAAISWDLYKRVIRAEE